MNSDLADYLEYLCSENDDINGLIVVSNEGLPIALASSVSEFSDQTLVSGMCIALKYIGRELISEITDSTLKHILVDCTNGVILILPLNQDGILVALCKNDTALSELNIPSIQRYFSVNPPKSFSNTVD
ncbi:MAG TPA: roadblock/LC7 domain-containing protein [Candidatus Nanopelagicaceae bacterium]|nr:roadblock/LC7 domain-containing protein [Candidatus Nanopelagicaceae bacterium]